MSEPRSTNPQRPTDDAVRDQIAQLDARIADLRARATAVDHLNRGGPSRYVQLLLNDRAQYELVRAALAWAIGDTPYPPISE